MGVAQARGPKIRPKLGVSCRRLQHIASHVATIFCNHLANVLQKLVASPKNQHILLHILLHIASHVATIFCNHLANVLQKLVASEKTQHIASHATIFCIILQTCYKRASHHRKPTHRIIACDYLLSPKTNTSHHRMLLSLVSSRKLVTKEHRIPENQHILLHIASSHATIFCIILQTCYKRASCHRLRLSFVSSCKLVTKEHRIPENQHILLHIASSHATIFVIILQTCYKRASHPLKPTHPGTHRIVACDYLLYHLANLLQKSIASSSPAVWRPKNCAISQPPKRV
jgi:hypothetical protein